LLPNGDECQHCALPLSKGLAPPSAPRVEHEGPLTATVGRDHQPVVISGARYPRRAPSGAASTGSATTTKNG